MPYLKIITNKTIEPARKQSLLASVSKLVATELSKPEKYMMVSLECGVPMVFAGTDAPTAFLELKAIGLPEAKTSTLAQLLCDAMEKQLGVSKDRVYINLADVAANMWGWNGQTFG